MRRKIWEDIDTQCSIVGTCLTLKELRKIARQNNIDLGTEAGEFEIHVAFVNMCAEPGPVAKAVNKHLDKKFAGAIRKFSKAESEDAIMKLWGEAKDKGDIPGPFWAVMTHPTASKDLRHRVFGDVHMLSHFVGATIRTDIRRIAELEEQAAEAQERRARARSAYRKRLKGLIDENRSLKSRVSQLAKEAVGAQFKSKRHCNQALYLENQALQRSMASQALHLAEEQGRAETLTRRLEAHEHRLDHLQEELREKQAEIAFLEEELQGLMERQSGLDQSRPPCGCEKAGTSACPGPDLCGKRILYVGGRSNLVQHYRDVVERRGGEFMHHDGGMEQARQVLPKLLTGVDAVLCPVDCVSHDACQCVKEVCKYTMKPCKFLRSSGLSSLVRCLEELTIDSKNRSEL